MRGEAFDDPVDVLGRVTRDVAVWRSRIECRARPNVDPVDPLSPDVELERPVVRHQEVREVEKPLLLLAIVPSQLRQGLIGSLGLDVAERPALVEHEVRLPDLGVRLPDYRSAFVACQVTSRRSSVLRAG